MARIVRLLKTPEAVEGVAPDAHADKRPIIAVVKKGRQDMIIIAQCCIKGGYVYLGS